jgi:tetratricopeptide (TPR) repeat protein
MIFAMTQRSHPKSACMPENALVDSYTLAARRLEAERPMRNARLRRIASDLAEGRAETAQAELGEHLARHPDDVDAINLLAHAFLRLGRPQEALSQFARCVALAPDFARAGFDRAKLLFKLDRFQAALDEIERLLTRDAGNPLFRRMKADILRIIGEDARSLALCEELATENPAQAQAWIAYGHALRTAGRRDEAIAAYRKAIECRPCSGLAWWGLAGMRTVGLGDADAVAIEEQLRRSDVPPDDRIALQFSLGKAFEDMRAYDRSFELYATANAALRLRLDDSSPARLAARAAAARILFTPEFLGRGAAGCETPAPIFIVGQPRSGSTLLEQILSSHSAVEGTAELPYIRALARRLEERGDYPAVLAALGPAALRALGEEYLRSASVHRKLGRPFFIDKAPANFWHVGLIRLILPNAKIIDARRNPAACLLSMFKLYFNLARPRLTELGRSYRDYVALMAHFDSVAPGKIHRVIYETLVDDAEGETRRMLDYLGLAFEESCLRFYETKRTVLTSSSEQVRKPISRDAVDSWRRYEPWLGPLMKSLGSAFARYPEVPEDLR